VVFGEPLWASDAGEASTYQADTVRLRSAVARLMEIC
jgi:hypothetical protein